RAGVAGLIFDIDGTLIDSNELHARAWREAFREFGARVPLATIRMHIGKGGDLLVPDILDARRMREFGKKVQTFRKELFRRKYMDKVRPFPGIVEAFEQIRDAGISIVLASSAAPEEVEAYVELLGVGDLIADTTSSGDAEYSKPNPGIFDAALDRIPAPKSRTAIVGDTPYDILAAHRVATPVAAVRCGGFPEQTLEKAEWRFDDVPQLVGKLGALDAWFRR
ncbi:MAG TPA: HAD family hydrolase, partial [Thermoanaerobaculia bacterium]|nr:HAD family hydrolase [Thermoanaerobaculia bacterium]